MFVDRDIPSIHYKDTRLADSPNFMDLIDSSNCYLAGWGSVSLGADASAQLNEAKLQILDHSVCDKKYSKYDPDSMICIGDSNGKRSCHGDSGSPFMCTLLENPLQYLIVGVNSFGSENCTLHASAVVKVSHVIDWIRQYSSDESPTPPKNAMIF